ncbi:uncharacterized protein [Chironomus tepperi]|uniref:uncharacterized protein n=1 Tax=Chironomus tepperi TaxID=113505 RepID=UPI00391EE7FF
MFTINKFLCFELEAGGKFLGWFGLIGSALFVPIFILEIVFFPSIPCGHFIRFVDRYLKSFIDELGLYECNEIKGAFVNILLFFVVLYTIVFVLYFLLLRGISTRTHKKILPLVVFIAIGLIGHVVFLPYVLFTKGPLNGLFIYEVFAFTIAVYVFLTFYSIYVKIRDENSRNIVSIKFDKAQGV